MIRVAHAVETDSVEWESYLATRGINHHAYSWSWRSVFSRTFGHEPHFLIARAEADSQPGSIVGVLPLYFMRSVLFGRALISVPYLNAGGIVANDEEAGRALLASATELARELEVDYLELRQREASTLYGPEVPVRTHKVSMVLPLAPEAETLFASFPPKLRSQIRRPSKAGMYEELSGGKLSETALLNGFYSVFSHHMRDLGTPSYPRRLFEATLRAFGDRARIITVWHAEKAVAAGITIGCNTGVEMPWAASLRSYNKDSPNMLLYWQAMRSACADGYSTFDFGRSSPGSGPYRFKQQWGPTPVHLHWYYPHVRGTLPDVNPNSPKYQALVRCWQLLPVGIANAVGSWLTKSIP